ncbi:hypothetical protein ACLOJK_012921 [Asimina triloba]
MKNPTRTPQTNLKKGKEKTEERGKRGRGSDLKETWHGCQEWSCMRKASSCRASSEPVAIAAADAPPRIHMNRMDGGVEEALTDALPDQESAFDGETGKKI